ncbi:MAG: NAD(P)H-quinone oxidoreductase [Propionibacteriaceae bacterium]|jgi:putative PIG3 family NAD(P)H quinone oxidoreductase|nr:NAD(P)H-quinone oxidoreductase [Propionibacteriaceae bacterium]
MRAITVSQPGGPEVLQLGEVPTPQPGPGELRIAVQAVGVNRADLLQRRGYYPPPPGISDIIGLEVSGLVDAVGPGVEDWRVGQAAVALIAGGGYAEYVVAPAGQCAAPPPGLDLTQAAGLVEVAATVVSNLTRVGLAADEVFLVHGGAGGIGSFAIPYAKALGAQVLTTAGSPAKAEHCRQLGADAAFDYHGAWASEARAASQGHGCDVILDIIGAKYLEANVSLLARHGRLVVIGLQGGRKGTLDINQLLTKSASLSATSLRYSPAAEKAAVMRQLETQVWPLYTSGTLPLMPQTVFPIEQAAAAHARLDSDDHIGKVVLVW